MTVLRGIAEKALMDSERSENIGRECGVENVNKWVLMKKKKGIEYDKSNGKRLLRIARDKSLMERKTTGKPRREWSDHITIDEDKIKGRKADRRYAYRKERRMRYLKLRETTFDYFFSYSIEF